MIDIKAWREAYNDDIINDKIWVRKEYKIAYLWQHSAMMLNLSPTLKEGKYRYEIENPISREIRSGQKEKRPSVKT